MAEENAKYVKDVKKELRAQENTINAYIKEAKENGVIACRTCITLDYKKGELKQEFTEYELLPKEGAPRLFYYSNRHKDKVCKYQEYACPRGDHFHTETIYDGGIDRLPEVEQ